MLHRYLIVLGATAGVAACSDVQQPLKVPNPSRSVSGSGGFQFTPLASSAVCTPGGNPNAPFIVPAGFTQTIVASEPDVPDAIDMNTQNETGPHAGRYLYRPAEGSIGAVTVTDLETGITKQLAFHPDWESMDPIAWTPWGTILVGEEATVATKRDPQYPNAVGGLMYEIFLNQNDPTTADSVVARPALGSKAHEGNRFDSQGNHYGISESNPGFIYKFVADRRGDLSSGQLYALKVTQPTGDRTGQADWIPLDRDAVQVDARAGIALCAIHQLLGRVFKLRADRPRLQLHQHILPQQLLLGVAEVFGLLQAVLKNAEMSSPPLGDGHPQQRADETVVLVLAAEQAVTELGICAKDPDQPGDASRPGTRRSASSPRGRSGTRRAARRPLG